MAAEPDSAPYRVRRCPQANGSLEFSQPERVPGAEYETGGQRTSAGIPRRLRFLWVTFSSPLYRWPSQGPDKWADLLRATPRSSTGRRRLDEAERFSPCAPRVCSGTGTFRGTGEGRNTQTKGSSPCLSAPRPRSTQGTCGCSIEPIEHQPCFPKLAALSQPGGRNKQSGVVAGLERQLL